MNQTPGKKIPVISLKQHALIVFDEDCVLCTGSVQFLMKYDQKRYFYFTGQHSALAQWLFTQADLTLATGKTLVLFDSSHYWTQSDAVLKIMSGLGRYWRFFKILGWFPQRWRDSVYDLISRHRYQWFGKKQHCLVPNPEQQSRFLSEIFQIRDFAFQK
ncbi:MAG: DUF393 domain-containing protein [SAR324 cluster bacterium]|nr:DUF393 domain-containing protein [SAR324 cluster bacterium]